MASTDTTTKNISAQPLRKRGRRSANTPVAPLPPRNQVFDATTVALGARIKEARKRRGMTQSDLAQSDFSKSYVSAVERGKIRPSIQALQLLASRLGLQVATLLAQPVDEDSGSNNEQTVTTLQIAEWELYNHKPEQALLALQNIQVDALPRQQATMYQYLAGKASLAVNQTEQAISYLESALDGAREAGDQEFVERIRSVAGRAYAILQGKAPSALERLRQGLEAIDQGIVRDPHIQFDILLSLSSEYLRQQAYDDVLNLSTQLQKVNAHIIDWRPLADHYWQLAEEARPTDSERAYHYAEKALLLAEFLEDLTMAARVQANIAQAQAHTGQFEAALQTVYEAIAVANRSADSNAISQIHAMLAQLAADRHQYGKAREAAHHALEASKHSTDRRSRAQALLALANVEEADKNNEEADQHYEEAIKELEQLSDTEALSAAYHKYGRSLIARGNAELGAQYLEQAYLALTRS